jgi:RNA polymerase sigma-70 factor (ECF subfamily)
MGISQEALDMRRVQQLTDAELVQMAWRGDSAAFGAVLDRHRVALFARALGWLGEREAAADAVQEAFVLALRRVDQLRDPAKVGSWLHAIVRSVCAMQLRRGTPEIRVADIAAAMDRLGAAASVEEQIDAMCLRDWVWAALAELPEPLRVAATLRYFGQHRSYQEIAATCGVPTGTVRSRLHQAKVELGGRLLALGGSAHPDAGRATEEWARRMAGAFAAFTGHGDPEPYAQLFTPDVLATSSGGAAVRGQAELRRWLEQDMADRVGYRLIEVAAGAGLTIVEAEFVNPPDDPSHCPPAVTQVLVHDGRDEVRRMYGYFAPRPDDVVPGDNGRSE